MIPFIQQKVQIIGQHYNTYIDPQKLQAKNGFLVVTSIRNCPWSVGDCTCRHHNSKTLIRFAELDGDTDEWCYDPNIFHFLTINNPPKPKPFKLKSKL